VGERVAVDADHSDRQDAGDRHHHPGLRSGSGSRDPADRGPRDGQALLDGKIDQWYSLQNRQGVVFILNVTDVSTAHEMLEKLPLGQAHLMSFELLPLGPLNPLRALPGMSAPADQR
jgi:hypothetical protein